VSVSLGQGGVTGIGLVDSIRRDTYKIYTRTTTTELLLFATDVARSGKAGKEEKYLI
jgi:hypothetical protein